MTELELFPLSMPLVPDQKLDLQIFEQRYLKLISRCLRDNRTFGVVAIREGKEVGRAPQVFQWGVEAEIIDWQQRQNGLLGVTVRGARPFTLSEVRVETDQLMVARVCWQDDVPRPALSEGFSDLQALLEQLRKHPMAAALGLDEVKDAAELGWQLCVLLPLSAAEKVALLSEVDPFERLRLIRERVETLGGEA